MCAAGQDVITGSAAAAAAEAKVAAVNVAVVENEHNVYP